jgi:hypothetical protein
MTKRKTAAVRPSRQSMKILHQLARPYPGPVKIDRAVKLNARAAQKSMLLPAELWIEMTRQVRRRQLTVKGKAASFDTQFMAGFACGWCEAVRRVRVHLEKGEK